MKYNLKNDLSLARFRAKVEYFITNGKQVELFEAEKIRGNNQSALFHHWVRIIAEDFGYTCVKECKHDIKSHLLGKTTRVNKITKEIEEADFETSKMSEKEMASFMEKLKIWAGEQGIYLPYWKDITTNY